MKTFFKFFFAVCLIIFLVSGSSYSAEISSVGTGIKSNWNNPNNWNPAVVPTATDNVTILTGDTISVDITNAACNNVTIQSAGVLDFINTATVGIVINGNLTINSEGSFKTKSQSTSIGYAILHDITIKGNLTNNGTFDMRVGSNTGPTVCIGEVTFAGTTNSIITVGPYSTGNNEFNSITINKSGSAKVILGSDISTNTNSSTAPCAIYLQNGIVETGPYAVHARSTSSITGIIGGSSTSYISGNLIRYMSVGSNINRVYPIGDSQGYRPLTLLLPSGVSNAPISAKVVHENAFNLSTFSGNIDKVSAVRYFELKNLHTAAFNFSWFAPSYGNDDGVAEGNTELRVATSVDGRATWVDQGPSPTGPLAHTTSLMSPPTFIQCDDITPNLSIPASGTFYIALARQTGTTNNSLEPVVLASISGTKYADVEADSSITGNSGIANWVIKLYKSGVLEKRVLTNALGGYTLAGLLPGTYTVEESLAVGWMQTYPRIGMPNVTLTTYGANAGPRAYSINVASGATIVDIDFGNFQLPSISGKKLYDLTNDSLVVGDMPLAGWIIKLYKGGVLQEQAVTNAKGEYIFGSLPFGTYTVEESLKTDWVQTFPRIADPNVTLTTYGTNAGPRAYQVVLSASENVANIDFGNRSVGTPGVIRSAGVKGNWSEPATWIGGVVPTPNDDVVIVNSDTVYYDISTGGVNNLTVGENAIDPTMLFIKNDANYILTIFGNILVSGDSARFVCQSDAVTPRNHTLYLKGDLLSTGIVDFKTGTSPNNSFMTLILDGTRNSILSVKPFEVEPAVINEFHAITVNKTGGAKVILNSDIGMSNISSAILTLTSGKIETGPNVIGVYSTSSSSIVGGSAASYIYGKLARGWASSGVVNNKIFPVGDSSKYRPVWVSNENSNYHLLTLEILNGDANTGTSILNGDIDKVSKIRYYKATAGLIPRTGTVPSPFYLTRAGIGYYEDDGVSAGNTNLRVGLSYNQRQNWTGQGPTGHTTAVSSTPTQILCDAFSQTVQLDSVFYFALARKTGTTDNPLEPKICKDIPVVAGWNLVSVPVAADNMLKTVLFPTSTSAAYAYSNGYINADTLKNGKGYWIKYGSPQNVTVCGAKILNNTVSVSAGWNLVGVYDVNVPVGSITTTPSGIISSNFFYYNSGYFTASTLTPGAGYWIKVSANGVLNLPTGSVLKQGAETNNIINSTWGKIIIEDNSGNIVSLYVSKEVENFDVYELPPAPPSEIFDARYSTNRLVENLLSGKEIFVNSDNYPIKLRVENVELNIKDILDGEKINTLLQSGEELVIEDKNINKFFVKTSEKPVEFELLPNSPNPFNPSTTIRYSIPVQSKVSLKIYSVFGQEIMTLVDEIQDVNSYSLIWNGKNQAGSQVASGVYYYRIFAEPISTSGKAFTKVNKMILMK